MSELEKTHTIAKETVEELSSRFSEPAWLVDRRLAAWEAYFKTPMPTQWDEGWKRADLSALDLAALKAVSMPAVEPSARRENLPAWFAGALSRLSDPAGILYQSVQEPGYCSLSESLKARGVILCDMATAVIKHADIIKPYLDVAENVEEDGKFGLLAKALFNCGMFLYVPAGVEIDRPFLYAVDLSFSGAQAVFPRTLVLSEQASRLTLAYLIGSNPPGACEAASAGTDQEEQAPPVSLLSQLVEVHVKPRARVTYLEAQLQGGQVFMINRSSCLVDRDGHYESLTLALGGGQTKSDMATSLVAPGAESEILGLVFGCGEEKFSFNTIQDHAATDTRSDINFRVALKDKSSSVYQGIVRVAKVAQRTNAYQSNKNLLLDGTATADSIPKLEILADDVKCSHGATVGPVDREQIFYLMSRGVSRPVAEQLIVLGFFRQTLELLSFKDVIPWLSENVSRKMHGGSVDASATDFFVEPD